ncbi:hypothetical protein YC2023_036622 [Brassica napus]
MSIVMAFVPFTKLRPFKNNWRVQVKCLHSFKQHTPFGGDSFEMILADQWVLMLDQKSSEDCPTPITKRKVDHSDLTDISSSSKKLCTKMIKQEKEKKE